MRLLPKKQLNVQVAQERKAQIDEGIKLAQKVDALRETLANLEKQQSEFINGMQGELQRKTVHLIEEVGELESEILELREKRKHLIPPIEEDVDRFREAQKELEEFRNIVEERSRVLSMNEVLQKKRDFKSKEISAQIESRNSKTIKEYETAEELKMEAQRALLEAQEYVKKQNEELEKKENDIYQRERSLTSYEFTLKAREETIEMKEEEIVKEKIRLLDQRQTLERAMSRLNK